MKKPLPVLGQRTADVPVTPVRKTTDEPPATRTILRIEGMDCASCASTVERQVAALPGVRRAVVNFGAGRLDAEHAPELGRREIEHAVEAGGYSVAGNRTEEARLWLTRRTILVFASALLFILGFALGLARLPKHRGCWPFSPRSWLAGCLSSVRRSPA